MAGWSGVGKGWNSLSLAVPNRHAALGMQNNLSQELSLSCLLAALSTVGSFSHIIACCLLHTWWPGSV